VTFIAYECGSWMRSRRLRRRRGFVRWLLGIVADLQSTPSSQSLPPRRVITDITSLIFDLLGLMSHIASRGILVSLVLPLLYSEIANVIYQKSNIGTSLSTNLPNIRYMPCPRRTSVCALCLKTSLFYNLSLHLTFMRSLSWQCLEALPSILGL
jgi:hypothetical protein